MPLRQSILSFMGSTASAQDAKPSRSSMSRPTPLRTETSSTDDENTIIVALPDHRVQLPTPSESATDVSSQGTDIMSMKEVPKGRAKRVSRRHTKGQSEDCLLESTEDEHANDRTVSGETLVNNATMSQTSLIKDGIAALNLPWAMSQVFDTGSKAELLRHNHTQPSASSDSLDTLTPTDEAEQESCEKAAAKKEKMDEKKKLREEKWKAEDSKATRRSSRASMLDKAGDMVSHLAATVLGKRKDRVSELRGSSRPSSAIYPAPAEHSSPAPDNKRRRLNDSAIPVEASVAQIRRAIRRPRDKKWLISGLYAGQPRTFEPRLTETKNKRKSTTSDIPYKDNSVLPLPMFAGERLIKQGRDFKLPFDIFSPLSAGQPKPDEWRKSNKNTFVGDASQEWRISKFDQHSTCMCKSDFGCDSDCMNRIMYYECDDRNCNLTSEKCGNRAFEGLRQRAKKGGKYNVGVEVIKTADRGYGVRSNRTFDANQIIVEYSGEIVTQEECEGRMRTAYKDNEAYYLMLFDQNMIIDATTRGSIARFVNHSCNPNCRMEKWTVGGQPRMALFAGDEGVMTGEELTYDYNFDPYSLKNVQECRCGERVCRGVLGPKTKEEKEKKVQKEKEAPEGKLKGVKRKIVEVVEESLANKKRKVAIKEVKTTWKSARPSSSSSVSPEKTTTRKKTKAINGNTKLVKKGLRQSSAPAPVSVSLERKPSKLKRMLSGAKNKAAEAKGRASTARVRASTITSATTRRSGRRVISTSSAKQGLLSDDDDADDAELDEDALDPFAAHLDDTIGQNSELDDLAMGDGEGHDGKQKNKDKKTVKTVTRGDNLRSKVGSLRDGVKRSVRR